MALSLTKLGVLCVLIVVFSGVPNALSRAIHSPSMTERHEQWMVTYGREYKDFVEKEKRYNIFKANVGVFYAHFGKKLANVEYIEAVNSAGNKPYKLGLNEYADLTNEEFKAAHISHGIFPKTTKSRTTPIGYENFASIPPSIDWRQKGAVTPIRGATCGDWAIPAVDTVEGLTKITTGKLYTLSVQEIVDCGDDGHGCEGGFTRDAFEFVKQHRLTTDSNYPSGNSSGSCNTSKEKEPVAKISGYEKVPADNELALLQAVAYQPVAVSVDASGPAFQFYSSGVFTGPCGTDVDHGVTLIGYGNVGELKYWLIKNTWGTTWGEDGYMRLERDVKAKEGLCGITIECFYPTV